jgi:glycosyltransferase involved in cell wall biosynthesis
MERIRLNSKNVRVCIIYPADPCGTVPGGIDTFIRGEINNAPDDIEYRVVGITTDRVKRPVGKWLRCELDNNSFDFFPVAKHQFTQKAPIIPVTVRYMLRLGSVSNDIHADVLEYHRIEPILRFRRQSMPMTAVLHQNMQSIYDEQADIRWASLPGLYFWLEDRLVPRLQSAFCVRADAAEYYRNRYSNLAETCKFQPTWADPQMFSLPSANQYRERRAELSRELGLDEDSRWLISVGRLDAQKNPMLLVASVVRLIKRGADKISLLVIGEGALRNQMRAAFEQAGVLDNVRFLGLQSVGEIAGLLHAADLFVMSSAYEGMPMAVIEALASGVPVATTRVGEVERVVEDRICGRIADAHTEEKLTEVIEWCLHNLDSISGKPCAESASRYSPAVVLEPVYENYRRLAALHASGSK